MATGRLGFGGSYAPSGRLDFDAAVEVDVNVEIRGQLPLFTASIWAVTGIPQYTVVGGALPLFDARMAARYDVNVWRGVCSELASSYQQALTIGRDIRCSYRSTKQIVGELTSPWRDAEPVSNGVASSYGSMLPLATDTVAVWRDAVPLSADFSGSYGQLLPIYTDLTVPWRDAEPVAMDCRGSFFLLLPEYTDLRGSFRDAEPLRRELSGGWRIAMPIYRDLRSAYKNAMEPPPGKSPGVPLPPPSGPACYVPIGRLDFGLVAYLGVSGRLHFTCTPLIPVIPIRPVYVMLHQIALTRVSNNQDIHASNVRLAVDMESWAWGLTATIIGRASADALDPNENGGTVEVEFFLDGYRWRFWVDKVTRSRAFPGTQYQATGRSLGAELAEPWYPARSLVELNARTAQQLAAAELPQGWTLAWGLTDWLVPANVFSYQGLTPPRAVKQIAQAAGGFAVCDKRLRTIRVAPIYKEWPWSWNVASPDRTIPASVITKLDTEWRGGTDYEAVWVQGQAQGRAVNFKRAGTQGAILAPSVVDPLITHIDAGRQRGGQILASLRPHGTVTFEMPISTQIPLLDLGELVWIEDLDRTRKTVVKAVEVSAGWTNGLTVRQSVTLEEHA